MKNRRTSILLYIDFFVVVVDFLILGCSIIRNVAHFLLSYLISFYCFAILLFVNCTVDYSAVQCLHPTIVI